MKKYLPFLLVGIIFGLLILFITYRTILIDSMEASLVRGLYYVREDDVEKFIMGEPDPRVSQQVKLVAIDEESLGSLGKWPWSRDVHSRYLDTVEQFSPKTVHFDIAFVMPEKVPEFFRQELKNNPAKLKEIENYYFLMDDLLAKSCSTYDNEFVDVVLLGPVRRNIAYSNRIAETENYLVNFAQEAAPDQRILYHTMEPLIKNVLHNTTPVTVNAFPDKDNVVRNFLLFHPYETMRGEKYNLFSILMQLLIKFYHVDPKYINIREGEVVLNFAKAPLLDKYNQLKVWNRDFNEIKDNIILPEKSRTYNYNLYYFIINYLNWIDSYDTDKIPYFPIHIVRRENNNYELLEGREIFDAAVKLKSKKINVVFYEEKDIHIRTTKNYAGIPNFVTINYSGRQDRIYYDRDTKNKIQYSTTPKASYQNVYNIGKLPNLANIKTNNMNFPDSIFSMEFKNVFQQYCQKRYFEVVEQAKIFYEGNLTAENIFDYVINVDPDMGKYFLYKIFFDETKAFIDQGALPPLTDLRQYAQFYPQWLNFKQLPQSEEYWLTEKQLFITVLNMYRNNFDEYYNKYLFTAAYATGMAQDIKNTPYGEMYGINIIINAFNTIVTENQLTHSPNTLNITLIILICIIFSILYGLLSVRANSYLFVVTIIATFVASYMLFNNNYVLKTIPLIFSNLGVFISIVIIKVLTEEKDKRFLKATFASYLSPELIDQMYESKTMPQLGGEARDITAYFTDIQGFSTFSEKLSAPQVVELLNEYLSAMTDILLEEKGTLDKYEGDAIIAFVGAPMTLPDHTRRSCKAAISMQNKLLEIREKWKQEIEEPGENRNFRNYPEEEWTKGAKWPKIVWEMKMRIGLNSGNIVTGNMGSATRMNYTMMGDAVNLAARLESGAKQYGVYTLVSQDTMDWEWEEDEKKVSAKDFVEYRFIDCITVVGKSEPVNVFEVVAMKGELSEQEKNLFDLFNKGIELYKEMKWDEALDLFNKAVKIERVPEGKTTPSQVYIERCKEFKKNPPVKKGEKWDGVYRLTAK